MDIKKNKVKNLKSGNLTLHWKVGILSSFFSGKNYSSLRFLSDRINNGPANK